MVGQALGLSTEWSNHPLYVPGGLELLDGPKPEKILVGPRVGINYALPEHVNALWRFAVADYATMVKKLVVASPKSDDAAGSKTETPVEASRRRGSRQNQGAETISGMFRI
ncbi:hypothetical protein SOVF_144570 [Spinacia oleracea]|nr:hypothetical protein SOVF_144570 [Spinacia oleracea]